MDHETVKLIATLTVTILAFVLGKYVFPKIPQETIDQVTSKVNLIINYADKFVSWAKEFCKDKTGPEKMDEVVKQLTGIAERYNIDITEDEIRAIAQKAYDAMIAGEKAADAAAQGTVLTVLPATGETNGIPVGEQIKSE